MTKICTKCGVEKPLKEFFNKKSGKFGKRADCKVCCKLWRLQWANQNRDKTRKYGRDWYHRNKNAAAAYCKTKRAKDCRRKVAEKGRDSLANWYVKKSLCQGTGIDVREVPADLVGVAREHIRLKRRLKEIKNGTYSYPTETDHGTEVTG